MYTPNPAVYPQEEVTPVIEQQIEKKEDDEQIEDNHHTAITKATKSSTSKLRPGQLTGIKR